MLSAYNKLQHNIDSDDYFGTLATRLHLMTQTRLTGRVRNQQLQEIVEELVFLQRDYKIVKK